VFVPPSDDDSRAQLVLVIVTHGLEERGDSVDGWALAVRRSVHLAVVVYHVRDGLDAEEVADVGQTNCNRDEKGKDTKAHLGIGGTSTSTTVDPVMNMGQLVRHPVGLCVRIPTDDTVHIDNRGFVREAIVFRSVKRPADPELMLGVGTYDVRPGRSPAVSSDDDSAIKSNRHDRGLFIVRRQP
jgi:hypothetical protein